MSTLKTPLFTDDGMFNYAGKRKRFDYVRDVSDKSLLPENAEYDTFSLWRKPSAEDAPEDCILYTEVNGYLVCVGKTDKAAANDYAWLDVEKTFYGSTQKHNEFLRTATDEEQKSAWERDRAYIAEHDKIGNYDAELAYDICAMLTNARAQYLKARETDGAESWPNFIGALQENDLENCRRLMLIYRNRRDAEEAQRRKEAREKEAKRQKQLKWEHKKKLEEIEDRMIETTFGKRRVENVVLTHRTDTVLVELCERNGITLAPSTKAWMNNKLSAATFEKGECVGIHWAKQKGQKRSTAVDTAFEKLDELILRIKQSREMKQEEVVRESESESAC